MIKVLAMLTMFLFAAMFGFFAGYEHGKEKR